MSWGGRRGVVGADKTDVPVQVRANSFFLYLPVLSRPSTNWMKLIALVRKIFFTHSTDSSANLFPERDRPRNKVLAAISASLSSQEVDT